MIPSTRPPSNHKHAVLIHLRSVSMIYIAPLRVIYIQRSISNPNAVPGPERNVTGRGRGCKSLGLRLCHQGQRFDGGTSFCHQFHTAEAHYCVLFWQIIDETVEAIEVSILHKHAVHKALSGVQDRL